MLQRKITLLLYAVLSLAICGCTKSEPVSSSSANPAPEAAQLKVYYFHRTIRCPSCEKIEAVAQKAVEKGFAGQHGRRICGGAGRTLPLAGQGASSCRHPAMRS